MDKAGNVYISDAYNHRIRKVDTMGIITTIAGNGSCGFNGDGVPATQASLAKPAGIAVDAVGNLYIADRSSHRVRKVDSSGIITTVAGKDGWPSDSCYYDWAYGGLSGDGGLGTSAKLRMPTGVAVDEAGNVYIADSWNSRIRKVDTSGIITTVAGSGCGYYCSGYGGDGGPATQAKLNQPEGVTLDSVGNIYFTDASNYRIRKVDTNGIITTIAGNGQNTDSGDNGPAAKASLYYPNGITTDSGGAVYVTAHTKIKKLTIAPSIAKYNAAGDLPFAEESGLAQIVSSSGLHTSTIDLATGKTLRDFGYDANNRLVSVADRFGNGTTIQRNSSGIPTSITSPDGQVIGLTVDTRNQLTRLTYPDGSFYSFGYTANGLMTDEYDPRGSLFIHGYDAYGRIVNVSDPEGGTWNYSHSTDSSGNIYSSVQTAEGNSIAYRDKTDLTGIYTSAKTDPTGEITTLTRSSDELTESVSSSCGMNESLTYGFDTEYLFKYLTANTTESPAGLSLAASYSRTYQDTNADKMPDRITDRAVKNGRTWTITQNALTGISTSTSPNGRTGTSQYDLATLLTQQVTVPGLYPATFGYDTRGRLVSSTTGSRTTTVAYDTNGYYDYIISPDNKKVDYTYDVMGRLRTLQRPDGSLIQYDYDLNGSMTVLTNPMSVTNTFGYTATKQRNIWTTPLSGSYQYSYDKERKLKTITFPSGKVISNTYTHGLLTNTATPEGAISYAYGCGSNLSSVTRGGESNAFTYDGTLVKTDTRTGTLSQSISYTYNNEFKLSSMTYAGASQSFGYDNDGLLTSAGTYTVTRNAQNGLPESVSDGTLTVNRTFNGYGEMDGNTYSANNTPIYDWTVARDNAGRIVRKVEYMQDAVMVWDYGYDKLGRLSTVKQNNALVESYSYDADGNRLTEANDLRFTNKTYTYSAEDHVLTAGSDRYQFDKDGFLTSKVTSAGTTTFNYSSRGELLTATLPNGIAISYDHDPMGRRIAKRVNGTIIEKYLWQGMTRLLAVYDGSNNLVMRFTLR